MHDPSTVAFDIKSPISWLVVRLRNIGKPKGNGTLGDFSSRYVRPMITIWHEDPMKWGDKVHGRSDDSCGWHTPHMRKAEVERWEKHARYQYRELFRRTVAKAEGESWAHVAYDAPDCYTAIYWLWRAIKHEHLKDRWSYRQPWQYGNAPTAGELEAIMNLATSPVDNLMTSFESAKRPPGANYHGGDDFMAFYRSVHRSYRRYHRPWWQHPRWHVHHWRLQVHAWQTFRRWALTRCAECGGRFAWGESPVSHSWDSERPKLLRGETGLYHCDCSQAKTQRNRTGLVQALGGEVMPDAKTNLFTATPEGHA